MTKVYFEQLLAEAYNARDRGDHARVWAYANQLQSMARGSWEKGEARTLLEWVATTNPEAAGKDLESAAHAVQGVWTPMRVTVVDFDMEFWSLVRLMVKSAVAAIPAVIILVVIAMAAAAVLGVMFGLSG